jgi:hypothetical protein
MAAATAGQYDASAGGKSFSKNAISAKWAALAEKFGKDAERLRDDTYKKHGRRNIPTINYGNTQNIKNWTPRR